MFRIVILLENESTTNQIVARWYCMALGYTAILLFFIVPLMFYSWHNTIWFESFIDFFAKILTPMATEKVEF